MVRDVDDGPVSGVKFHAKMLDVYHNRLLGFCRFELISPDSLLENTLFSVLDVASSIAAKDVGKLNPVHNEIRLAWARYAESLESLKDHSSGAKMKVEQTYERLKDFARSCDAAFGKCP
jgi:hypothetical protein